MNFIVGSLILTIEFIYAFELAETYTNAHATSNKLKKRKTRIKIDIL